jgi:hypothetical protein
MHAAKHLISGLAKGQYAGAWDFVILRVTAQVRSEATAAAEARTLRFSFDQKEAFRHIVGSCSLTRMLGANEAKEVTDAHEAQDQSGRSGQKSDSDRDQVNNDIGRKLAVDSGNSGKSCESLADQTIATGDFGRP